MKPHSISPIVTLIALTLTLGEGFAFEITATTEPVVTGSGAGMTARYENVGSFEGTSIDVFAEILSYSPAGTPCIFTIEGDDMKFQFRGGATGMERNATIRWTFYESGTTNPVSVDHFTFTIDDLDNLPTRRESLSASNASGYDLNSPTNVTAAIVNGTVTATGGVEQNSGDPEGAIRLYYNNLSSYEISYHTIHGSALVSAYHHDGNGDFTFSDPVYNPIAAPLPKLYYTYHFINDCGAPKDGNAFFDSLPDSLVWDTSYSPVTTGGLTVDVAYGNGDRDAAIADLILPPGESSLTLKTVETIATGTIANTATLFLADGSTIETPPDDPNSTIELPDHVFEAPIVASSDDALEAPNGAVTLDGSGLTIGQRAIGLRFAVALPVGATITNAYVQFTSAWTGVGYVTATVRGQAMDDAPTFAPTNGGVTARPTTNAAVPWTFYWTTVDAAGPDQRTPDLSAVIQEIIDRPGWTGDFIGLSLIPGNGQGKARSFDASASAAPVLHLEYQ